MPKRPAWGAMPPRAKAFSSWTSPRSTRPRQGSFSVGAMRGEQLGRRPEDRVLHPEGLEDAPPRERVERLARHPLEDLAEQDHAQVAVERLRARLVDEVHGLDALEVGLLALELLVERHPPVEARGVGQQLRDGDLVLGPAAEPGRNADTGLSRSSLPSSTRIIAIVVVTTILVRLARS